MRTATGLSPRHWPATSEARTARMARPQALRSSRRNASRITSARTTVQSAISRSENSWPASAGGGMLTMPLAPPVSERHSIALFSMMKPKAIVTMAR